MQGNGPLSTTIRTKFPEFVAIKSLTDFAPLAGEWVRRHPNRETGELGLFPVVSRGVVIGVMCVEARQQIDRHWDSINVLISMASAIAPWMRWMAEESYVLPVPVHPLHERISERQTRILELVREGLRNGEIAQRLGFSESTVRAELSRVARLLGTRGRKNTAIAAERAGL